VAQGRWAVVGRSWAVGRPMKPLAAQCDGAEKAEQRCWCRALATALQYWGVALPSAPAPSHDEDVAHQSFCCSSLDLLASPVTNEFQQYRPQQTSQHDRRQRRQQMTILMRCTGVTVVEWATAFEQQQPQQAGSLGCGILLPKEQKHGWRNCATRAHSSEGPKCAHTKSKS